MFRHPDAHHQIIGGYTPHPPCFGTLMLITKLLENIHPHPPCFGTLILISKLLEDIHPHPPFFGTLILITKLLEDIHPHPPCPAILSSSPNYWRIYTPIPLFRHPDSHHQTIGGYTVYTPIPPVSAP